MRRWEIRRQIQSTHPFDLSTFAIILLEKLMEKGLVSDEEFMEMLREQVAMADVTHYE